MSNNERPNPAPDSVSKIDTTAMNRNNPPDRVKVCVRDFVVKFKIMSLPFRETEITLHCIILHNVTAMLVSRKLLDHYLFFLHRFLHTHTISSHNTHDIIDPLYRTVLLKLLPDIRYQLFNIDNDN